MKYYKEILLIAIVFTITPFILLLSQIDFGLYTISPEVFWSDTLIILGSVTGMVATILLMWSLLLGIRFFTKYISSDIIWINKLHKWLGKYGGIFALLHPVILLIAYSESLFWLFFPNVSSQYEIYLTLGKIAFFLLIVIWITSVAIKDFIQYRHWLWIHYLTYPIVILSLLHAKETGVYLEKYTVLMYLWNFLIFLTVIFLILRLIYASGILSYKYRLLNTKIITDGLYEIKIKPKGRFPKKILPGQYFYIQKSIFGETHPFSVMRIDNESNELIFGIKAFGKFTNKLKALPDNKTLNLDGPYGVFTQNWEGKKTKIVIAGGIGVTPFVQGVISNPENTYLLNCNPYLKNTIQREEMKNALGENYYDFISREEIKEENVINGRINFEKIEKIIDRKILNLSQFYICGSKKFILGIKTELIKNNIKLENINIEEFF